MIGVHQAQLLAYMRVLRLPVGLGASADVVQGLNRRRDLDVGSGEPSGA